MATKTSRGTTRDDSLTGSDGDDIIDGGAGNDNQYGGSGQLSIEILDQHAADLTSAGKALSQGGDLPLWSCHTGQGEPASDFHPALARATGLTIEPEDAWRRFG